MFWTPEKQKELWRFPDKMPEAKPPKLQILEQRGGYVAQQKLDGWRLVVMLEEGRATAVSRHQKVLPVSQGLLDSLLAIGIPMPAMLDTEWAKMRGGKEECLYLLDGLYIGGEWMGGKNLFERRESYWTKPRPPQIYVPNEVQSGFVQFLSDQIEEGVPPAQTISEGVVVKKVEAKLIGSRTLSEENGLWAKVKWRHGQGGDTVIVTKEQLKQLQVPA